MVAVQIPDRYELELPALGRLVLNDAETGEVTRALALAGLMALIVVVAALALTQTSTVAAPPPPLRGPFRFVELPKEMSCQVNPRHLSPGQPFYTQTFGTGFYSDSHWNITTTTPCTTRQPRICGELCSKTSTQLESFTDTLWVKADAKQGIVYERYNVAIRRDLHRDHGHLGHLRPAGHAAVCGSFRLQFDF